MRRRAPRPSSPRAPLLRAFASPDQRVLRLRQGVAQGDRMTERHELLDATDEMIEDAVKFADPMILRGLLYQLTGDESVAATPVKSRVLGLVEAMVLADRSDAALLQSKAA